MSAALVVNTIGPSATLQDMGRSGWLAYGLSKGGAADAMALAEGQALLHQGLETAALEMVGTGGSFTAQRAIRIALTGAPMKVDLDGEPLAWNTSHQLKDGQTFTIGAARVGNYGYLHVGGGFTVEPFLQSRSTHLAAAIGAPVKAGDILSVGPDVTGGEAGLTLPVADRFCGGTLRILPSVHTFSYHQSVRDRFCATPFSRTLRGNRQGAELKFTGNPFSLTDQLNILSEPMLPGDVQMTGEGYPYVLLCECQTTGGYPRIGTILPDDLPIVAQSNPAATIRFSFISHESALKTHRTPVQLLADLRRLVKPRIRNPQDIPDLLNYQLISGMVTGQDKDQES